MFNLMFCCCSRLGIIEHSGIGSNKPVLQMEGLSMPPDGDDATPQRYHRVSLENKYFATKVHFVEFNDTFTLSVKLREHFYGAIIYMDLDNVTTQTDKCIEYMEYVKTFPSCSLAFVVSHPVKEDMDKAVLCRLKAKLEDNDFDIGLLDFDADQDEHNSAFFHFTDFLMSMQTIDWPHAVFKKDPTAPADSDCKAFKFEELFCNLPDLRSEYQQLSFVFCF